MVINICELTLRIKHLPSCLTDAEKEDFVKHFGAKHVKIVSILSKQKSIVYAKFETKTEARTVLQRIHQLKILDAILCVEYAEQKIADSFHLPPVHHTSEVSSHKNFINYVTKINALNSAVGFDQPPPAHLRYSYPRANRATINNISYALDTVPQFYYQVLHLMNRMNLPPPFSNVPNEPVLQTKPPTKQQVQTAPPLSTNQQQSESESEIESDGENNDKQKQIIPAKRQISQSKPIKRPKFIGPPKGNVPFVNPGQNLAKENVAEVFEQNTFRKTEKIALIVDPSCLEPKQVKEEANTSMEVDSVEKIESTRVEKEVSAILSAEELATNRLPEKDLSFLPIFKDYHPGTPNSKLYIKNIAKTVTLEDLQRIYKRFCLQDNEKKVESLFEIKLMTEGRMKGQAFVTLDSVELAQQAVKETNGYILKDKPLVVVFAKTPPNKKNN